MAQVFSVSTQEELLNALSSAQGGDTIELQSGDYGKLELITFQTFGVKAIYDTEVTITSADPNDPASFSGMDLREVQNLTFDNVIFDSDYSGATVWASPFRIQDSSGIRIENSLFEGELASGTGDPTVDGFATGKGLVVEGSSDIVIENNEFTTWHRAMTFGHSSEVIIFGNDIHSIRSDGINFTSSTNISIENNYIHDFLLSSGSGDHSDMIQFWTSGTTTPSTNIIIRGNILDMGDGDATQSIFMRNEVVDQNLAGIEMYYQNVKIENNTIYNGHSHGISVGETDGLTIQNNTVLYGGDANAWNISGVKIPKISVASGSKDVIIDGNISSKVSGFGSQSDWVVSGNAIIHPNNYFEHFVTSSIDTEMGVHKFSVLPGSLVDQLSAGSDIIHAEYDAGTLIPQFQVYSADTSAETLVFDASLSLGPQGFLSETEANFLWNFGDGSTANGQIVKHEFDAPGYHDVELTIVAEDGTTAKEYYTAGIAGNDIVQFDPQLGDFEKLAYGEETPLNNDLLPLVKDEDGYALKLGGEGKAASVGGVGMSRFLGTDAFELSMSLKSDSTSSWGGNCAGPHQFYSGC